MIGFIAYLACGLAFCAVAVYAFSTDRPIGVWSRGGKPPRGEDAKRYNQAMGKAFLAYGVAFALCGLPMLFDAHPALLLIVSVLGIMAATVAFVIAAIRIDQKHRIKR